MFQSQKVRTLTVKAAKSKPASSTASSDPQRTQPETLAGLLARHTGEGTLWKPADGRIRCVACGHRCLIAPGRRGICQVRFNENNRLRVPFGYTAGVACDPVEKKPFFHVLPGSDALTFGMLGCDFHCSYCQNWVTSQALRDDAAAAPFQTVTPVELAAAAVQHGARLVVSSYNEPLITAEWAVSVFKAARMQGLLCAFVSNGNATAEALDYLQPWLAAYKVDLKGFDDRRYRTLGGTLDHVTETIQMIHRRGLWLEVVTLVVPGFNDGPEELRAIARFLASVSRDIPWHVTAFHPDYKLTDPRPTQSEDLVRTAEIGTEAGLHFVYAGNLPGHVGEWENTRCPGCHATLIARHGYLIQEYKITATGTCPHCGVRIPGLWPTTGPESVRTGTSMAAYYQRLPRRVKLN